MAREQRRYADRLAGRQHILPLDVLVLTDLSRRAAEEGRSDVECGIVALAEAVDAPRRSVERSLRRLREAGLIASRERGRGRNALITIVRRDAVAGGAGSRPARAAAALVMRPAAAGGAPIGFIGDRNALHVAQIVNRMRGEATPVGVATSYLEHATPAELSRLDVLRDEDELYPDGRMLTGDPQLDEGLRTLAITAYRRARSRRVLGSLGTYRDPLDE